jgi:hypothetical protein
MSNKISGKKGTYREASAELGFFNFAASLVAKADAFVKMRKTMPPPTA